MSNFITITSEGIKQKLSLVSEIDPILHEVMPPFFEFGNEAIDVANILIEAVKRYDGLGLSANQIGLRKRCFVVGNDDNIVVYFNPEITYRSDETTLSEEGCLSFPGLHIKIDDLHLSILYTNLIQVIIW